jgi:hypothetical protein
VEQTDKRKWGARQVQINAINAFQAYLLFTDVIDRHEDFFGSDHHFELRYGDVKTLPFIIYYQ